MDQVQQLGSLSSPALPWSFSSSWPVRGDERDKAVGRLPLALTLARLRFAWGYRGKGGFVKLILLLKITLADGVVSPFRQRNIVYTCE